MVSPVQGPPPQPPSMPPSIRRQRRSVAGPVVLILLGVVLLLTTMHVLQPQPLLSWSSTNRRKRKACARLASEPVEFCC